MTVNENCYHKFSRSATQSSMVNVLEREETELSPHGTSGVEQLMRSESSVGVRVGDVLLGEGGCEQARGRLEGQCPSSSDGGISRLRTSAFPAITSMSIYPSCRSRCHRELGKSTAESLDWSFTDPFFACLFSLRSFFISLFLGR